MEPTLEERVAELEARLAEVENKVSRTSPSDDAVKAAVKDFVLTACDEVFEREDATWASELFAWFAAFMSEVRGQEVFAAVVFFRALRELNVGCRSWQIKRADEQRNGVVYMVRPSDDFRKKHAAFVVACTPAPDVKQSGALTLRKVRSYANRRLRTDG